MYLTLPNTPFDSSHYMVVNLFSQYPARQERYMELKKKLHSPNIDFKDKIH